MHLGAKEQFPTSNQSHSIILQELANDNDWAEEIALWRLDVHKLDGTLYLGFLIPLLISFKFNLFIAVAPVCGPCDCLGLLFSVATVSYFSQFVRTLLTERTQRGLWLRIQKRITQRPTVSNISAY